jgi:hypothetical protein
LKHNSVNVRTGAAAWHADGCHIFLCLLAGRVLLVQLTS